MKNTSIVIAAVLFAFWAYFAYLILSYIVFSDAKPAQIADYADKHGQKYALQPCECVDGVAPNGCGHLLPITKTDRPNKGEALYFALDKTARIDTVWIEQATGLDCNNYELWKMVKH